MHNTTNVRLPQKMKPPVSGAKSSELALVTQGLTKRFGDPCGTLSKGSGHLAPSHEPCREKSQPAPREQQPGGQLGGTGPAWGYHGYEYGLTLGNLLRDVAGEEAAWESRR